MLFSLGHHVARFFKFSSKKNEALLAVGNSETTQGQSEPIGDGKNIVVIEILGWKEETEQMRLQFTQFKQMLLDLRSQFD